MFSANGSTNKSGFGRAPVGVDAQLTILARNDALSKAFMQVEKVLAISHVGEVLGPLDGKGNKPKETLGPSNMHKSINVPWSYVTIKVGKEPETIKAQTLRLEVEAKERLLKKLPTPKDLEVVKTTDDYRKEYGVWLEDCNARMLHLTKLTYDQVRAKLRAMGYGLYKVDKVWRTRSDGTAAVGYKYSSKYESQHVGREIAFKENNRVAASAA
jgi:hypothetical protein